MTSFVEKRSRPRSSRQRAVYWTRKVLRISLVCFVTGIFAMSALTAGHKAVTAPAKK